MSEGLEQAKQRMVDEGIAPEAIDTFARYYKQVSSGETGLIREDSIDPLTDVAKASELNASDDERQAAMSQLAVIKLNGGLGTSMGLSRAKTLIEVRDGLNFLDIIARQILSLRSRFGVKLPLVLMNSFHTHDDAMAALDESVKVDDLPLDFLQSQEPKLRADDLSPVSWPDDPSLEWCPPGHGDLYPSLRSSGVLDQLIEAGLRYAFVSNGDNLGATPDPDLAAWFAASGAPMAMEVCRRTVNDKKGGHLAVRKSDGHLVLRESAQTSEEDMSHFTDETRHMFFNTNNLWFDLVQLRDTLNSHNGVLGLPLIRNQKTVDPTDPSSTPVIQIESAMGSAVEVFDGAQAIEVPRRRFAPVKTTNELAILRSDLYELGDDGTLNPVGDTQPEVTFDKHFYKKMTDFEQRVPHPLGLRQASSLRVQGDVTFGRDVQVVGNVELNAEQPETIADGTVLGE